MLPDYVFRFCRNFRHNIINNASRSACWLRNCEANVWCRKPAGRNLFWGRRESNRRNLREESSRTLFSCLGVADIYIVSVSGKYAKSREFSSASWQVCELSESKYRLKLDPWLYIHTYINIYIYIYIYIYTLFLTFSLTVGSDYGPEAHG